MPWGRTHRRGLVVGVDIGGTKLAAGVVTPGGHILARRYARTPGQESPEVVEKTITEVVTELGARHRIRAVGVAAAGFVDRDRSTVLFAPHLSWRDEPLRDALRARLGVPVVVENDANAAAWAEVRVGTGVGESSTVLVNLGTGIGGSVVQDGRLYRGRHGTAGEFGHMTIVPDGHRCECGNRGCWEQYASGNALVREARDLVRSRSPMAHALAAAVDGDVDAVTGPLVTSLARGGDRASVELLESTGEWLGLGLANLADAFDPGLFVIGGGVSEADGLLLDPARRAFRRNLAGRGYRPEAGIVPAGLGNDAGMIGVADLARATVTKWDRRTGTGWHPGKSRRHQARRRR
ncbi:ROK family glucokinase [Spiractinospora alimapuensis]|uniref:ROK family glucokinase n=1 Tax=Spiractinospora alimapuensis TaxID=2820884 RepID=UPI001F213113|nr:ROK family glucokinase [Spiractinospora alimapuensis]QVQ50676.1 ROK family glucokinase [Spiractinospora alimapuensis]